MSQTLPKPAFVLISGDFLAHGLGQSQYADAIARAPMKRVDDERLALGQITDIQRDGVGISAAVATIVDDQRIRVREKVPFKEVPAIQAAIETAERELDGNGRVVVRYSGTEALARVMVEAESEQKMKSITATIAQEIQKALGA